MLKGSVRSPLGALRRIDEPKTLPRALPPRRASTVAHKELASIDAAFDAFGITDGSTLSFHHHFRNGDRTVLAVMECAARRGLRGLTLAASSLFPVHDRLREHIASGVVQQIVTSYLKGAAADAVTDDDLQGMALLQSHGGRARAIAAGELRIDAAFIAAPCAERNGAATGRAGALACGPLGYAMVDAAYARHTAVLAHEIRDTPLPFVDIPADQVDAVVPLDRPGTTAGIRSGATVPASTAAARKIGHLAVEAIRAAGLLHDGLSLQSGAGGYSLAAVPVLAQGLRAKGAKGGFVSGGITGAHVKIVAHGLAREIRDVQCFDQDAILSSMTDPWHKAMSAAAYASPIHSGPVVDDLGVVLLGAIEIDRSFNVNVVLGGDGRIRGGPGGHPDTAQGAARCIVTTGLTGGGYAKIVDEVRCVSTLGEHVDVLITDEGVAVNPVREILGVALRRAGLPVVSIDALADRARALATCQRQVSSGAPCALVEARDGRILDVVSAR